MCVGWLSGSGQPRGCLVAVEAGGRKAEAGKAASSRVPVRADSELPPFVTDQSACKLLETSLCVLLAMAQLQTRFFTDNKK